MADGSIPAAGGQQQHWQRPSGPPQGFGAPLPPSAPSQPSSAFWARDAVDDPWRNPSTAAVVQHTPTPRLPPTEPPVVETPTTTGRPAYGLVVTISAVVALLAGALGAGLGVYAVKSNRAAIINGSSADRPHGDYQEIIAQVMPSVVTIWANSRDGGGNGSGWVYSSEGYIVTNHHVAAMVEDDPDATLTVQFADGTEVPGEVVGSAHTTDVSVIKVDAEVTPLTVADSGSLVVGDPVVAIGAPLGLGHTVTDGIVSALDRPVTVEEDGTTLAMAAIQTDAAINPGNSGGPLFNAAGEVVGINTLIYAFPNQDGEAGSMGLGFAIAVDQAARIAEQIIDTGRATRTVLGTQLAETGFGDIGATVTRVADGTPAESVGLAKGDVITKFNDVVLTSDVHLTALVLKAAPGDSVTLTYERDGTAGEVTVQLAAAEDE